MWKDKVGGEFWVWLVVWLIAIFCYFSIDDLSDRSRTLLLGLIFLCPIAMYSRNNKKL